MKINNIKLYAIAILVSVTALNCNNDDDINISTEPNFSGTYTQEDQMGRPAVNTVFVSSGMKDAFNTTIPSEQGAIHLQMQMP